ncbi:hypothetical protein E2C01_022666 [Portunus trituberculatus]|uniref:Uncharacterized protein n=1 Tax=Portunus trituberculatus TaxID=210409 RepID=A0A5B7E884_PORTR|nr:hypothetical protein [Portunus trituberculatus]
MFIVVSGGGGGGGGGGGLRGWSSDEKVRKGDDCPGSLLPCFPGSVCLEFLFVKFKAMTQNWSRRRLDQFCVIFTSPAVPQLPIMI